MKSDFLTKKYKTSNLSEIKRTKNILGKIKKLLNNECFSGHQNELEIFDIPRMIGGLEYHFKRLTSFEKKIEIGIPSQSRDKIYYEMLAYFNTIGSLYSLFSSTWFKVKNLASFIPTLLALVPFRHKISAQRSCDFKKNSDSESQKQSHTTNVLFTSYSGKGKPSSLREMLGENALINLNIKINKIDRCKDLKKKNYKLVKPIEELDGKEIWLTFSPSNNHPQLMKEILSLIESFVSDNENSIKEKIS